mmetsp:Transcript_88899/g.246973  ORF Transcript_88899/g.246973 Transcript_88899/m.246973 type:complete len:206 (-) Transcript_88899:112-729(-)
MRSLLGASTSSASRGARRARACRRSARCRLCGWRRGKRRASPVPALAAASGRHRRHPCRWGLPIPGPSPSRSCNVCLKRHQFRPPSSPGRAVPATGGHWRCSRRCRRCPQRLTLTPPWAGRPTLIPPWAPTARSRCLLSGTPWAARPPTSDMRARSTGRRSGQWPPPPQPGWCRCRRCPARRWPTPRPPQPQHRDARRPRGPCGW